MIVEIDKNEYEIVDSFSELTASQQIMLAAYLNESGNATSKMIKIALMLLDMRVGKTTPLVCLDGNFSKVKNLASIPDEAVIYYYLIHKSKRVHLVSAAALTPLLSVVESSFFVKRNNALQINVSPAAPIPHIKIGRDKYLSYEQHLTNLTLGQFIDAEVELSDYYNGGDDAVYRFVSILYSIDNKSIKLIKRAVSESVVTAVRLNYEGQKVFLYKKFSDVFGSGESGSDDMPDPADVFDSYCKLVATLSGGNPIIYDEIRAVPLYNALYTLEERLNQIKINQQYA